MARGRIYKRGKTYTIVYDRPRDPVTGARRQQTQGGFRTRKEADAALGKVQHALATGTDLEPTTLTVGEYLAHWLTTAVWPYKRQATAERYESHIRRYLTPALGAVPLARLTPAHVSRLQAELLAMGLAARTVLGIRQVLSGALRQAVRWELVSRNVCDAVDPPRPAARRFTIWTAAEAARFAAAVASDRLGALFVVALVAGLRRGELLGLEWRDVDLTAGVITVQRARVQVRHGTVPGPTKSGRERRIVLTPAQVALLKEHRRRQLAERLAAGPGWDDHDLVFCQLPYRALPGGRPISIAGFAAAWARLCAAAGVPRIRPHDLRHTNATAMLDARVSLRTVQERLGHASPSTTLGTYAHVTAQAQAEAAAALDAYLAPPSAAQEGGQ